MTKIEHTGLTNLPTEQVVQKFLEPLSTMRREQCLSQTQVAEKLGGASRSHIAAIEQGKVIPRLDTYLKLLSLYGYTVTIEKKEP